MQEKSKSKSKQKKELLEKDLPDSISLIGMPGSGKTTLGQALAQEISRLFLDTDHLLEAWYGQKLEEIRNKLSREEFLKAEELTILKLQVPKSVIATGGSVIYCPKAMQTLHDLGTVIYLKASCFSIKTRVSQNPQRGLIMDQQQTLEDLFQERSPMYAKHADFILETDKHSIENCLQLLKEFLYAK